MTSDFSDTMSKILHTSSSGSDAEIALAVITGLTARGWTVATAESLTGGAVCAALTAVPGASSVVIGGVVSYATEVKSRLLHVDEGLLTRRGAVDPDVAMSMVHGVRDLLGTDCAIATTGSAGPDPAPGGTEAEAVAPGRVFIAIVTPDAEWAELLDLRGDRESIRSTVVHSALQALDRTLRQAT